MTAPRAIGSGEGGPRALSCSHCGAPVGFQTPFCVYCRAALQWSAVPVLGRGPLVGAWQMPNDKLPGVNRQDPNKVTTRPDGVLFGTPENGSLVAEVPPALRDACIGVVGVCLDGTGGFGVSARVKSIGGVRSGYFVNLWPGRRAYMVSRFLANTKESFRQVLRPWETLSIIGPPNTQNHVELRLADAVLQVYINGILVTTLVDAVIGFGQPGWRVGGFEGESLVLLQRFEIWRTG